MSRSTILLYLFTLFAGSPASAQTIKLDRVAQGDGHANTISFVNSSGQPATVKLIGPLPHLLAISNGSTGTVSVPSGTYHFLVRYGTTVKDYRYGRGAPFEVNETATESSQISITLHQVIAGNYAITSSSEREFARALSMTNHRAGRTDSTTVVQAQQNDSLNELRLAPRATHDTVVTGRPHSDIGVSGVSPALPDGGFEAGMPTQWSILWGGEGDVSPTTTQVHSGLSALRVRARSGLPCGLRYWLALEPNTSYELSAWVQCMSGDARNAFLAYWPARYPGTIDHHIPNGVTLDSTYLINWDSRGWRSGAYLANVRWGRGTAIIAKESYVKAKAREDWQRLCCKIRASAGACTILLGVDARGSPESPFSSSRRETVVIFDDVAITQVD